jgi:hypothetical protein
LVWFGLVLLFHRYVLLKVLASWYFDSVTFFLCGTIPCCVLIILFSTILRTYGFSILYYIRLPHFHYRCGDGLPAGASIFIDGYSEMRLAHLIIFRSYSPSATLIPVAHDFSNPLW